MAYKKKKKRKIDWESIWVDYRAGILSIREISRKHKLHHTNIIRKAKKLGVKRDLGFRVKQETVSKLHTGAATGAIVKKVDPTPNITDEEIIDKASDEAVDVVLGQRKDLSRLRTLEDRILEELDGNPTKTYIAQYRGEVVKETVDLPVTEKASALYNLASVQKTRILLERQAYGIGDDDGGDKSVLTVAQAIELEDKSK